MSASGAENGEFEAKYVAMELEDVIRAMKAVMSKKEVTEDALKEINKEFDYLRLALIPKIFEDRGISNMKLDGVGRVGLTADIYASIPADRREEAYQWLSDTGHGDLIGSTVNASTLKAFLKGQLLKGEELPDGLFKVTPFTRASITKV